jgi:alpha-ribazole phosphatase
MSSAEKLIIMCRHLPTEANQRGLIMGRTEDYPITLGAAEKYKASLDLLNKKYRLDEKKCLFYTSPMLRCRQTCNLAISSFGSGDIPIVDERLNETDCGTFAGHLGKELKKTYPELVDTWMHHPENMRFPEGESYTEVQSRVLSWLNTILNQDVETVLAFSHVDAIKMMIFAILKIPISSKRNLEISPGSFNVVLVSGEELVVSGLNLYPQSA